MQDNWVHGYTKTFGAGELGYCQSACVCVAHTPKQWTDTPCVCTRFVFVCMACVVCVCMFVLCMFSLTASTVECRQLREVVQLAFSGAFRHNHLICLLTSCEYIFIVQKHFDDQIGFWFFVLVPILIALIGGVDEFRWQSSSFFEFITIFNIPTFCGGLSMRSMVKFVVMCSDICWNIQITSRSFLLPTCILYRLPASRRNCVEKCSIFLVAFKLLRIYQET